MIGKTLGHYRIDEKLGAGGMGEVYRAHDERLERDVALKVLPAGTLFDESARHRFRKEALALAKLNHPNIAAVYDFDTQDGVDFLVMECVAGVTLSEKLSPGPLAEKEVLRLGVQLAEGLTAAHEQGVIHRDLKPGNLSVTRDGRLKILDFGLAKLVRPMGEWDATASLTETHAVAGTLPYMAPEQLRGEPVDARTDLYAAGCVLYEMAAGQRAFREEIVARLTDSILHKTPQAPSGVNRQLAPELERIILKCLEKDPENRYQSAKELGVDLRRLGAPSAVTAPGQEPFVPKLRDQGGPGGLGSSSGRRAQRASVRRIRSLAVLPLENLSRDPEQEYFADGMTEALITDLAKIGALKVISRTTVMRYRGTSKPLPEIATELGVEGILEGSVLRAGERVRITAQLIHAASDTHLWAESYERDLRDVLALQSDVAQAIAREIQVKLKPQEKARLARTRRVNPEAHDALLRGSYHWTKWTREGLEKGAECFQQAIAIDPAYAPAYAGLAQCYAFLGYWNYAPYQDVYPKAKAAALRAVELDESLASAHCALGAVRWFYDWDLAACEREFQRALELNPNDAIAHTWYGLFLAVIRDDFEGALAESKRAQERDPLALFVNICTGWTIAWAGQSERAIEQAHKTLELDPRSPQAYYILGRVFIEMSRFEEAIAAFEKAAGLSADEASLGFLIIGYAVAGQTDKVQGLLSELQKKMPHARVPSFSLAVLHLAMRNTDQAIEALEKAYEERDAKLFWVRFFPGYDALKNDPRLQDLLRRMKLPQ